MTFLRPLTLIIIGVLFILAGVWSFYFFQPSAKTTESVNENIPTPSPAPSPITFTPLTIADIFAAPNQAKPYEGDPRIRTVIATGDIIPVRMTNVKTIEYNDFLYPYRKTSHWVKNADITFGNLETPLMDA